jgi:hypothetical protein
MREHVFLFCLLGLVLTATIILVAAPGAVTWDVTSVLLQPLRVNPQRKTPPP